MNSGNKESFLLKFDFLGLKPELLIHGNRIYRTKFSSILSIIVIIASVAFAIYSVIDYFQFKNPQIIFARDSGLNNNMTIFLNDSLLMFAIYETEEGTLLKNDQLSISAEMEILLIDKYKSETRPYEIEKCELGKNINMKFKGYIEREEKWYNFSHQDFYCLSNSVLNYNPDKGHNMIILHVNILNTTKYNPEHLKVFYYIQNDAIDHYNKKEPLHPRIVDGLSSYFEINNFYEFTVFLDYLEYKSDNGYFFSNIKTYTGFKMGYTQDEKTSNEDVGYDYEKEIRKGGKSHIGDIIIRMSGKSHEHYNRSYMKLQTLLANIKVIITIFILVGDCISYFIIQKQMSIDIVRSILNKKTDIQGSYTILKNFEDYNEIFGDQKKSENNDFIFNKSNMYSNEKSKYDYYNAVFNRKDNFEKKREDKDFNSALLKTINEKNKEANQKNEEVLNNLKIFTFIKSYFSSNSSETKLIGECQSFVENELSIEVILKKLSKLEKIYYILSDVEKAKVQLLDVLGLKEINEYLSKLNEDNKNLDTKFSTDRKNTIKQEVDYLGIETRPNYNEHNN